MGIGYIPPKDSDGAQIQRGKAAPIGWSFQLHGVCFTTASDQTFYNKDKDGNNLGYVTYTMYDSGDNVTTTNANAVKTVIDWMTDHDFEIVGGRIMQDTPPTSDMYLYVTAAPGIADIEFAQGGINLKLAGTGGIVDADGRVSKRLNYNNPVPGTNKFRITVNHNAGVQHELQMLFEIFKG